MPDNARKTGAAVGPILIHSTDGRKRRPEGAYLPPGRPGLAVYRHAPQDRFPFQARREFRLGRPDRRGGNNSPAAGIFRTRTLSATPNPVPARPGTELGAAPNPVHASALVIEIGQLDWDQRPVGEPSLSRTRWIKLFGFSFSTKWISPGCLSP